ncbi:hypothetical protein Tsubulata_006904 [Turnera subulata]|uniref:GRAM domain-containing protein n=1 Tax=Turnera subulata TaxID=218843 RepID=A0A9Q0GER7_9ROSI|nr:hypothetical protein Tsubulata_006904 [Turnera subulata]
MDHRNNYNHDNNNPYIQVHPSHSNNGYGTYSNRPGGSLFDALNRCGKKFEHATRKAEVYADNIWRHMKVNPSFTDAAMARISQGTKVLAEGGYDKVFQRTFETQPGEKLLKPYVCYFSTSSGPITGTLYVSTKKVAFCSDHPFCYYTPTGGQQWIHYKVVIPLNRMRAVNPSSSRTNPHDKYIQIVSTDDHEFWFMGFISYDKALKQLREALERYGDSSSFIPVA